MLLLSVFLISSLSLCHGCSPINFPDSVGFEATMYNAPVVVSGRTVQVMNLTNHVIVSLDCIYKAGNESISVFDKNITIDGRYYFNSCTTTFMELNENYLLALWDMNEFNRYEVYEPNIGSTAAYKVNDNNMEDLLELCGLDPSLPDGVTGNCQKRSAAENKPCQAAPLLSVAITTYPSSIVITLMALYVAYLA